MVLRRVMVMAMMTTMGTTTMGTTTMVMSKWPLYFCGNLRPN
jgi:hypothetical protein